MDKKYYVEYLEAIKVASDNPFQSQNNSLIGGVVEASEGRIVDTKAFNAELDDYFNSFNTAGITENPRYQEYKVALEKLNYLSRRAQYYNYSTATNEELETFKQNELRALSTSLRQVEATASAIGLNLNQNVNATPFDITSRPIPNGSYKSSPTTATEKAVSLVDSYQNEGSQSRKSILGTMAISEYQQLYSKTAIISSLTIEQYKAYRINQIALSQEEMLKMGQDLQNDPSLIEQVNIEASAGKAI